MAPARRQFCCGDRQKHRFRRLNHHQPASTLPLFHKKGIKIYVIFLTSHHKMFFSRYYFTCSSTLKKMYLLLLSQKFFASHVVDRYLVIEDNYPSHKHASKCFPQQHQQCVIAIFIKKHLVMVTSVSSVPMVASLFSVLVKTRKGIHSL